jgi:hypothetical protein
VTRAELLELSDERDGWLRRVLAAERDGYERGHRDGWCEGYAAAETAMAARWAAFARPAARQLVRGIGLQRRRWQVRGQPRTRESFAEPHPDDFPGTDGAA